MAHPQRHVSTIRLPLGHHFRPNLMENTLLSILGSTRSLIGPRGPSHHVSPLARRSSGGTSCEHMGCLSWRRPHRPTPSMLPFRTSLSRLLTGADIPTRKLPACVLRESWRGMPRFLEPFFSFDDRRFILRDPSLLDIDLLFQKSHSHPRPSSTFDRARYCTSFLCLSRQG